MKLKISITIIIFIFVFVISFIIQAPVSKVLNFVNIPNNIYIEGVSGSITKGAIKTLYIDNNSFQNITWNTSILGLLKKQARFDISDPKGYSGYVNFKLVSNDSFEFEQSKLKISLTNFLHNIKYEPPMDLSGFINVKIDEGKIAQKKCKKLKGSIDIRGLIIYTPIGEMNLGNPIAILNCRNGVVIAKIEAKNNEYLSFEGNFELNLESGLYSIRSFVKPDSNHEKDISTFLEIIGKKNSSGIYEIIDNGKL